MHSSPAHAADAAHIWATQSVDTMKYSRDFANTKKNDPSFKATIQKQLQQIASTGATYVAIATPYDSEFLPFLKSWVDAARKQGLHVWFRGNWSGWEGWFGYPRITRAQHIDKTRQFILQNPDLFADGDIFSPCPECENGGPGDPRMTGDIAGHRAFLISEYQATKQAFQDINKDVISNYISMNADEARLIMNKDTTKALDGIVTIDHYVKTPEQLDKDITDIAEQSGGKVVLGEWGAPIPDLQGSMTDAEQAAWIDSALKLLSQNKNVVGLNYWINTGGSTELWSSNGIAHTAVSVLQEWYKPHIVYGFVRDELGAPIENGIIRTAYGDVAIGGGGYYRMNLSIHGNTSVSVIAPGYITKAFSYASNDSWVDVTLVKQKKSFFYRVKQILNMINPWGPAYAPIVR